jgi:hypothetical protein
MTTARINNGSVDRAPHDSDPASITIATIAAPHRNRLIPDRDIRPEAGVEPAMQTVRTAPQSLRLMFFANPITVRRLAGRNPHPGGNGRLP